MPRGFLQNGLAALILFLWSAAAVAQDCDAILRDGVFDVSGSGSDMSSFESLARHYCNSNTSATGGGLTVVIDGVPIGGNAYQQSRNAKCEQLHKTRSLTVSERHFVRAASQAIVTAWNDCMTRDGVRFSLKQAANPKIVDGFVGFRSASTPAVDKIDAVISLPASGFEPSQCSCGPSLPGGSCSQVGGGLQMVVLNNQLQSFSCRRATTGALSASITSTQGNRVAQLPALSLRPTIRLQQPPYVSGGSCSATGGGVPLYEATLILEDLRSDSIVSIYGHGVGNNLGARQIDLSDFPLELTRVRLAAPVRNEMLGKKTGLWVAVTDGAEVLVIEQRGNRGCQRAYANFPKMTFRAIKRDFFEEAN